VAITSATITSRAVTEAVEKGLFLLKEHYALPVETDSIKAEEGENVN